MLPNLHTLVAMASPLRDAIHQAYLADEQTMVGELIELNSATPLDTPEIAQGAAELIKAVRDKPQQGLDALLQEYDLSNQEGVALMCLAEALLRIPDRHTAEKLINDKLADGDWQAHFGHSPSLFVNATTWGLMLSGRWIRLDQDIVDDIGGFMARLVARSGEPAIRMALTSAMRILGHQFVMGKDIRQAWRRSHAGEYSDARFSFDMLGEAALTEADAKTYLDAYHEAIEFIGAQEQLAASVFARPGVSIKLSALHPRFEFAQRARLMQQLVPRVRELVLHAQQYQLGLTIDAEECERWMLTLDTFEEVYAHTPSLHYEGFGIVVQTYQKRALASLRYLIKLARRHRRRIPLRLVKGAYWDTEIKRAQEQGLKEYPVFTRKVYTDLSYLTCARVALDNRTAVYPQFATHNAHNIAAIASWARNSTDYEFQRLHGMGVNLYEAVCEQLGNVPCRVYAPVGDHARLLPYLVRRLLENGANTSFVNRISDQQTKIETLIVDPLHQSRQLQGHSHRGIPLPADLYKPERANAAGLNLHDERELYHLSEAMTPFMDRHYRLAENQVPSRHWTTIVNPADHNDEVGEVAQVDSNASERLITQAQSGFAHWSRTSVEQRAETLERVADLYETHHAELMSLVIREGGRCIPDALSELREAVDFCRYYAWRARQDFTIRSLPGPTGERNSLTLHPRGVFACISPWNFPLAIFTGQIAAALAAGNSVIAKPAGATPLIALRAISLMREAGVPPHVVQAAIGAGKSLGEVFTRDARIAGVAFTGSTDTAWYLNRALAQRPGPIVPLIAETGGQNAMIVDSSALREQVVTDVLRSAFNSAGQRCSALRVLYLQEDIAESVLEMLGGALRELRIGNPAQLATDIGPVIDRQAQRKLQQHLDSLQQKARLIQCAELDEQTREGSFIAPHVFEIRGIDELAGEVFGPILHVIRFNRRQLDEVIESINATGYGLTLGIHTRVQHTARYISERVRVGNIYINRNMVGSVVGVQPFGGEGLSGTGPKAGGPHYLRRFATERTVTDNISAVGGNPSLLSMDENG